MNLHFITDLKRNLINNVWWARQEVSGERWPSGGRTSIKTKTRLG